MTSMPVERKRGSRLSYNYALRLHGVAYPTGKYVGASLDLFASVALLFLYILRFMRN